MKKNDVFLIIDSSCHNTRNLKKDDIVVYRKYPWCLIPSRSHNVGRIVGIPGETSLHKKPDGTITSTVILNGQYWMHHDNKKYAFDSRDFGPLACQDITGTVISDKPVLSGFIAGNLFRYYLRLKFKLKVHLLKCFRALVAWIACIASVNFFSGTGTFDALRFNFFFFDTFVSAEGAGGRMPASLEFEKDNLAALPRLRQKLTRLSALISCGVRDVSYNTRVI